MKQYQFSVVKILGGTVTVEANSVEEAENIASETIWNDADVEQNENAYLNEVWEVGDLIDDDVED